MRTGENIMIENDHTIYDGDGDDNDWIDSSEWENELPHEKTGWVELVGGQRMPRHEWEGELASAQRNRRAFPEEQRFADAEAFLQLSPAWIRKLGFHNTPQVASDDISSWAPTGLDDLVDDLQNGTATALVP